jgi:hypothetical protein
MKSGNDVRKINTEKALARNILKLSGKAAGRAMGLAMAMQGLAMAGGDTFGQLQKMTASDTNTDNNMSLPSPAAEEARLSLKERIPAGMQGKLLALSSLARNILNDPRVAQLFSADPAGYLAERGLGDVTLDLGSHEVKVVLALGDEDVREAAAKGDKAGYLKLMEDRGLLRFNGLAELGFQDSCEYSELRKGEKGTLEKCTPLILFACFVTMESDATVKSNAVIFTAAEGTGFSDSLNSLDTKATLLMWGKDGARELLKQHATNKADELAESIAGLKIAKEKNLTKEQIRTVIERKLLAAMAE